MNIVIVSIHVAAAVILVLTVLLQAGKGSGMGAAFGGASGTVFGTRGPATLISKITCAAAVIFMLTSLNLALSQSGGVKRGSVMDDYQASPPAATSPAPAATPAPVADAPAAATAPSADAAADAPAADESAVAPAAEESAAPALEGSSSPETPASVPAEVENPAGSEAAAE